MPTESILEMKNVAKNDVISRINYIIHSNSSDIETIGRLISDIVGVNNISMWRCGKNGIHPVYCVESDIFFFIKIFSGEEIFGFDIFNDGSVFDYQ